MNTFKLSIFLFLFSITSTTTFAQTADEIVSKYIKKIGGADKLKKIKGVKMEMTAYTEGMEFPFETVKQNGGKMYSKMEVLFIEIIQMASDGNIVWRTGLEAKPEKFNEEITKNEIQKNADFLNSFLDYKTKGYSVEYIGKEKKGVYKCFKIKLTKKPLTINGNKVEDVVYYFFDTNTYLPLATETEILEGEKKGQYSSTAMSDYQNVDGILFPFTIGEEGVELKVNKITLNPIIEDSVFAFPEE